MAETKKMTARDLYNAVINGKITDAEKSYATAELAKLDARNAKRKEQMTEKQKENEDIMVKILSVLKAGTKVASEIGALVGVSTNKASSLCLKLVERGLVTSSDVKVKGGGKVKGYTLVPTAEDADEEADEVAAE